MGIGKGVSTLFCMDKDYNKNLFVTLSARNLDKNLSIISLVSTLNEESKMKLAGASHVVNPYDLGSHRAYRLIRKPKVFDVLDSMIFQNLDTKIDEVKVSKNSSVIDVEFQKLTIEKDYNLLLIGVESTKSGKFYYNTHKVYRKIKEDDTFVVAGNEAEIERFKKELA
jgi:voltage-gated potassium channel